MREVAVLYARPDSIYNELPACDVWDKRRDAASFPGGKPVIAHPPCAAWGRLRGQATRGLSEKWLALLAVDQVRRNGGVLEHPFPSLLWPTVGLPEPGSFDAFGGYTLRFPQFWFGHKANKSTQVYIVGCPPDAVPPIPLRLGTASHGPTA